jgi:hypothetical protein
MPGKVAIEKLTGRCRFRHCGPDRESISGRLGVSNLAQACEDCMEPYQYIVLVWFRKQEAFLVTKD